MIAATTIPAAEAEIAQADVESLDLLSDLGDVAFEPAALDVQAAHLFAHAFDLVEDALQLIAVLADLVVPFPHASLHRVQLIA